jgi:hypothetical protein
MTDLLTTRQKGIDVIEFAKEKDMLPIVMEWLSPQVTFVETELWCGYAGEYVPDIVGIVLDLQKVSNRKRTSPRSRGEIRKIIESFDVPQVCHTDMVAVELKLSNFVEAYFQAKMYQSFGFRSYIAMPEGSFAKLKMIRYRVLQHDGIGLIEVSGKCKELLAARPSLSFSIEEEAQISERLICRYVDSAQPTDPART